MLTLSMKRNSKSETKTVLHLKDVTMETLVEALEAKGYDSDLMAEHLWYGFKVYAVNAQGSKGKDKRNPDLTEKFLVGLGFEVEREDDVPVARADEATQEAKNIAKALKTVDAETQAKVNALLGITL